MKLRKCFGIPAVAVLLLSAACSSTASLGITENEGEAIPVDDRLAPAPEYVAIIAPYKEKKEAKMSRIIGLSARELTKGPIESTLGNFVADLTEEKAEEYAGYEIDMGGVTTGGLRAAIPKGTIHLGTLYELMPFENLVWVLELSGPQTRQLFEYAAERQSLALSGSRLVVENKEPVLIEINGEKFDPEKNYTLAISDYLARGGDEMTFLQEARVLDKLQIKLRDMIIEKVTESNAAGEMIDAEIEGRIEVRR